MTLKSKRQKKSRAWMNDHVHDPWVQKAQAEGWRSRAVFKLAEIDAKDRLFRPGMTVVDLGCTPGSWSQYAVRHVQPGGRLVGLDLLPMVPLSGMEFIQGDFREDAVLEQLLALLDGRPVDLVLSDMAPNLTGISVSDQARMSHLGELTLDFCDRQLKPGGSLLVKVFQGADYAALRQAVADRFDTVVVRKPAASRDRSAETYLLARNRRG